MASNRDEDKAGEQSNETMEKFIYLSILLPPTAALPFSLCLGLLIPQT